MKLIKFKSIASRIILSVVPLFALFTLIYIVIVADTMNAQIKEEFNERMLESLNTAELSIQTELVKNADVADSLARYAQTASLESIERGELKEFLINSITSNPHTVGGGIWYEPYSLYADEQFFGPYVYVADGKPVFAGAYGDAVDFHEEAWYVGAKDNSAEEVVWTDVYYDPVADVTMITASVPFFDGEGEFLGVATADMALTNIKQIASSISIGETGAAFILGANGEYVSFLDGSRDIDTSIIDDEDTALQELGVQVLGEKSGSASLEWNDVEYRAFFTTLSETNWHLIAVVETAEVGQEAVSLIISLSVVPIIGLILVSLCIVLVSRSLKRVADKVNSFADKAAAGDLTDRIRVTEHDEFGVMETRLNTMMDNMASMNEQLTAAVEDAQAANSAKTKFLSNMSHEMRTPMNAIIGMTQVAKLSGNPMVIQNSLQKIDNASRGLLELINNVLDMAKIEADKIELEIGSFSLSDTLQDIRSIYSIKVGEKSLTLKMDIDPAIPKTIWSDRFRYSQIVTNLLSNAIKFTPEEGKIFITASVVKEDDETVTIETCVKDSGIGVSPDASETLFQSFQQADSSISRRYGGTGLGLSISKDLARLMGGDIWCMPNQNEAGSSFFFTIKANKTGEVEVEITPEILRTSFEDKRILLVEDVEINREIVLALLEGKGIEIECAENGVIACEMFAAKRDYYDLIFMDIQMPEMDGLEATRQIRAMEGELSQEQRIPIVAMSANAFKEDREDSLAAGMNDHLSKPVEMDQLMLTLNKYLA